MDLRIGAEHAALGQNRYLLIERLKKLERMELAQEEAPSRWSLSDRMEKTLRELGERGDIIKTMHRAITERGLAHGAGDYIVHDGPADRPVIGRVIGKGLAGDELGDRVHLVIDGADGRAHYVEMSETTASEVRTGSIVEIGRAEPPPRPADRTIADFARDNGGTYEPALHLAIARDTVRIPDGNYEGYVESHVRRLEALRRSGIVERIDAEHWRIPADFEERAREYDAQRTKQLGARVLSLIDLDAQVTANAATWLDRSLISNERSPFSNGGFGREAMDAMARRRQWLIDEGFARAEPDRIIYRRSMLAELARRELDEAGRKLARERGGSFYVPESGERISGTYRQSVQLVSGKYALVERSREFTLVPWRPVIEKELGKQVAGLVRGDGISWELGRQRGIGIGM